MYQKIMYVYICKKHVKYGYKLHIQVNINIYKIYITINI